MQCVISEIKMQHFCQQGRRPKVNKAIVDVVSRSRLKSRTAVKTASLS